MVEEYLRKPENRWRSAKRWTEWEDALLKKHFPKEGSRAVPKPLSGIVHGRKASAGATPPIPLPPSR